MASEVYWEAARFDAYPLPWSFLGTITCPLVHDQEKCPEYPKICELAVSEMRQDGQDMREHIVMVHVDQIYLGMDTLNRSSSSRRRGVRMIGSYPL